MPQTKARVLPAPASGLWPQHGAVRLWDVEAHVSCLLVQYQRRGETIGNASTIFTANGGPAASSLSAQLVGFHHNLLSMPERVWTLPPVGGPSPYPTVWEVTSIWIPAGTATEMQPMQPLGHPSS